MIDQLWEATRRLANAGALTRERWLSYAHDVLLLEFREEDHPRGGKGTEEGGRFVAKGNGGTPADDDDKRRGANAAKGATSRAPKKGGAAAKKSAPLSPEDDDAARSLFGGFDEADDGAEESFGADADGAAEKPDGMSEKSPSSKVRDADKYPLKADWNVDGEREATLSAIRRPVPFKQIKPAIPASKAAGDIQKNATLAVAQYAKKLSGEDATAAHGWASDTARAMVEAYPNADAQKVDAIMRDAVDRLVYQHRESMGRALTDHGIRHITGDVDNANMLLDSMESAGLDVRPQDRAAIALALVNHDYGYTSPDMRTTFDNAPHVAYSAQLFERDLRDQYAEVMGDDAANWITYAIATHSDSTLDWEKEPLASAVRMADNFSLFQSQKLPNVFRDVDGSLTDLEAMWFAARDKDAKAFDSAKARLSERVAGADLDDETRIQLGNALKDVSPYTAKVFLWRLAGDLEGLEFGEVESGAKGAIARLSFKDDSHVVRDLFGVGAREFLKFAKDLGADESKLDSEEEIRSGIVLRNGSKAVAKIVVDNPDELLAAASKMLSAVADVLLLYRPDQERDEGGRWTDEGGGGGTPDEARAAKTKLVEGMRSGSAKTWGPRGPASGGRLVPFHPNEGRAILIERDGDTKGLEQRIAKFVDEQTEFVNEDPDRRYFRSATDERGRTRVEVVERFGPGEEEASTKAGAERNVKTIYTDEGDVPGGGTGHRTESAVASRAHAPHGGRAVGTPNRVDEGSPLRAPDVTGWHHTKPSWVKGNDSRDVAYVDGKPDHARQALHGSIVGELLRGVPSQAEPKLVITMGGAASGKSSMNMVPKGPDWAHLDADEVKKRLPEYREAQFDGWMGAAAYVHEESSEINKKAIAVARERKMNVVIDTVGKDPEKVMKVIREFRAAGYVSDEVHYLDFDFELARPIHDARAEKVGREVPEADMRDQYKKLPSSFSKVAKFTKKATAYNRREPGSPAKVSYNHGVEGPGTDPIFMQALKARAE